MEKKKEKTLDFDNIKLNRGQKKPRNANKSLECVICKADNKEPCAAKCGHIACHHCWVRWLKVSKTCPLCKIPCTTTSLRKLNFISSSNTSINNTVK